MPSWQPDWTDVAFDHAVAGVYALACDEAARELHRWVDRREAAARRAAEHWEGPHRVSFDHRLAALHQQARTAALLLSQDGAAARQASALARREQDHRDSERRRWYAEQAWEEEQARQEQAREQAAGAAARSGAGVP